MAHPKRKTSVTRRKKRRTHQQAKDNRYVICSVTGEAHLPHKAYWHEDQLYYRGKVVMKKET